MLSHKIRVQYVKDFNRCLKGKKAALRFGITMTRERAKKKNKHSGDCYFCSCHVREYNGKNQYLFSYVENIPSAISPVNHGPDVPVPLSSTKLPVISQQSSNF